LNIESPFLSGFSFGFNVARTRDYLHDTTTYGKPAISMAFIASKINYWRAAAQVEAAAPRIVFQNEQY